MGTRLAFRRMCHRNKLNWQSDTELAGRAYQFFEVAVLQD